MLILRSPTVHSLGSGPGPREGPGRRRPVIAGHKCDHRAGTGKTDGINRTYAPVIGACFVIAGQKWRSSPRMTLDHAGRPVRRGVSRGNGGNARPAGRPGRRLTAFDPRSDPVDLSGLGLCGEVELLKVGEVAVVGRVSGLPGVEADEG